MDLLPQEKIQCWAMLEAHILFRPNKNLIFTADINCQNHVCTLPSVMYMLCHGTWTKILKRYKEYYSGYEEYQDQRVNVNISCNSWYTKSQQIFGTTDVPPYSDTIWTRAKVSLLPESHYHRVNLVLNMHFGTCKKCHYSSQIVTVGVVTMAGHICIIMKTTQFSLQNEVKLHYCRCYLNI